MFSSTINEFLDREGVSVYPEKRLGKKTHKVGESRQCFARDEIHPSSYVPWFEVELSKSICKTHRPIFWHIMSIYL